MTTIITRLYDSSKTANDVQAALLKAGHQQGYIDVIPARNAAEKMEAAQVGDAAMAAYTPHLKGDAALVVVRAPFTPFGAAASAIDIVDSTQWLDVGLKNQNRYIRIEPKRDLYLSVLTDHPRYLTQDISASNGRQRGLISALFGLPLLSKPRERNSAMSGGGFMSTKFLPIGLLSKRKPSNAVIPGGKRFSDKLGWPTISRRA